MKTYFVLNKFGMLLLMVAMLVVLAVVAFAQTSTEPQLLWGWNPTIVSAVMGVVTSVLSSILMHVHWSTRIKQWFVFGLSMAVTIGVGVFSKNISLSGINATNVGEIAATVFTMTHLTYLAFSKPLDGLQEKVNSGKVAAPTLPE